VDSLLGSGSASGRSDGAPHWMFLTNHFLVLVCVARSPDLRVRDIAKMVGITERATQAILSDLDQDGYIERRRTGRRNHYNVHRGSTLRHPLVGSSTVGDVLAALSPPSSRASATATSGHAQHVV
jgi:predicted DNA-binding transcriptional regulator